MKKTYHIVTRAARASLRAKSWGLCDDQRLSRTISLMTGCSRATARPA